MLLTTLWPLSTSLIVYRVLFCLCYVNVYVLILTRECSDCNALQLESAWRLASPVFIRFNYDADANIQVAKICPFLSCSVFTADTLRYAVTLAFDPVTLNICSTWAVKWSKYAPHMSEIEQSAAELLTI